MRGTADDNLAEDNSRAKLTTKQRYEHFHFILHMLVTVVIAQQLQ